jgi:hypothetical protein
MLVLLALAAVVVPARASAQEPPPPSIPPAPLTPITLPLVPVPVGCEVPLLPYVVFVGEAVTSDYRTVRFRVEQIRSGRTDPFAAGLLVDIRYGIDAQYIEIGERYLVSAPVDPALGLLVSRVTDEVEDFGGDEVIGVSESDVSCPPVESPNRTLNVDGTRVEAALLEPFWASRSRLISAILLPLGVGFAVVFALAMVRLALNGLFRGVTGAVRPRART